MLFKIFNKILKPSGYITTIFHLFRQKKGIFVLRILEQLEQMGFKRINPISEKVSFLPGSVPLPAVHYYINALTKK